MQRTLSAWLVAALALAAPTLAISADAAAEPKGLLETIKRHSLLTSTVPSNGDQNPSTPSSLRRSSAGKIQKDEVLVDNFNDRNNLQGLGTTIVKYNMASKELTLFSPPSRATCRRALAASG